MKVVKVEDVEKAFEKSNNMLTAYDFNKIPSFELPVHKYTVELSYVITVSAYSEDSAIDKAEKLIGEGQAPYESSCVTKID